MRLSAALALYAILSLAPLLVILFKVAGVIWQSENLARKQITEQLTALMGPQAAQIIRPMLNSSAHSGSGTLAAILSSVVLLFSASGVFAELQDAMDVIWDVKAAPNRGLYAYLRTRVLSLAMVFGIAFLLLVSMFVSA
ncbi:MAG TPA: YhjD/YihY/BrkB family envelope integrity protein, partial [Tepidisphaeraceae bacterium]|nr:YhjD/YihY/BrkB family envelope integrity protein [Tepidisphaeraceae bacterium]